MSGIAHLSSDLDDLEPHAERYSCCRPVTNRLWWSNRPAEAGKRRDVYVAEGSYEAMLAVRRLMESSP